MRISERDKVFREIIEKIIGGTYYYTLNHAMKDLSVCEENYEYLKALLNDKRNRINAAYVLQDRYIPEKAQELFTLFSASDDSYIRRIAADIGKECSIDLTEFFAEMDRRSKTTLENSECKIAFLAKYTEKYHVDISDNGESAVIYNPVGEEHILFSYCGDEYTISFSFQHIHPYDQKDAESWIDDVVSDELLAIRFCKDEGVVMATQIHPSAIRKLTYESLRAELHHGNRELYEFSDSFNVRSWSGEKDLDAQFVCVDGKVMIKAVG